ncbi:SMI1/KNR4 family protein [Pantoea dispersa]|uniref:SMI1/KNR4 family protein n=1 Tax=Pantoea dispersa TaxID=59814 RepID=UPI002DBF23A6|nr:SMI1/KNR4 family protein [Pantoea dispersa]MEB5836800.1 SMI1/KNR4 family protein [Pantoea dispersa]
MKDPISKLLSICSNELAKPFDDISGTLKLELSSKFPDYVALLRMSNGFYGFESALHVFPGTHEHDDFNVFSWNEEKLWRESYGGMTDGHFFFAEDAFGGQFSLKEDGIYSFDPETGESQKMCENLSQWCDAILNDYDFLTGHSLMHQWQIAHGKIKQNQRLVPVIPFVLGGEFSVKNLRAQQSVTAMRARGSIAVQFRDMPDSGTIKLNVDD